MLLYAQSLAYDWQGNLNSGGGEGKKEKGMNNLLK